MAKYTLNDALVALARYVLPIQEGAATSGAVTYLADNVRVAADEQFNNGVIFFLTGTFAGTYAVVTDYDVATGKFTFASVSGAGIATGTLYMACALISGANLYHMIGAINQALASIGDVLDEDTTLTTVDTQESYDLPTGVFNVQKLEIARSTDEPYNWDNHSHFKEINDDLRIPYQYACLGTGYPMRLTYLAPHSTLDGATDPISNNVNKEWLKLQSAINLIQSLANRGVNWSKFKVIFEQAQERVIHIRPKQGIVISVKGA